MARRVCAARRGRPTAVVVGGSGSYREDLTTDEAPIEATWVLLWLCRGVPVASQTLCGQAVIEMGPTAREKEAARSPRAAGERSGRGSAMGPVVAGMEADRRGGGGRYGAFGRHEGRRGRLLDVLVEWEGENSDGDLWDRTWRSHGSAGHVAYRNDQMFGSYLSADLRAADARKLLAEGLYLGPRPGSRVAGAGCERRRAERTTVNGWTAARTMGPNGNPTAKGARARPRPWRAPLG